MCKIVFSAIILSVISSQPLMANTYPRPLQILLEGVEDTKERARLIRIYQRPVTPEDKKLVRDARAKAASERGSNSKRNSNKKKRGKKRRR